jgi:hypothetical protein
MARKKFGAVLALSMWMSLHIPQYYAKASSAGTIRSESVTVTATKEPDAASPEKGKQDEGFFHNLLDVINPLQHLPIIGTIYRAITGDKMGPIEKIAGDTLYGGMWGAITSIADVAFEGITGKSFEDTALALFKGDGRSRVTSTRVAATSINVGASLPSSDLPSLPSATMVAANASDGPDVAALTSSMSAKGVDNNTAIRALYAYRRSMGLAFQPAPVLASVH